MLKNKTKIMVLLLVLLIIFSTFSFATDDVPTPTSIEGNVVDSLVPGDNTRTEVDETTPISDSEIHNGDLYVYDDNIKMDQLVDGNVFLFGNNIEVTGKVNGSLYAFGNNVSFSQESYVVQSIYVMANTLTLNGSANDLYAFARKVDMAYDSFMIRDLRVCSDTFNFNGGVGRDAFVTANNFNFVNIENSAAIVYGNLTYSAPNELSLTSDLVQGEIKYQKELASGSSVTEVIIEKIINICAIVLYAFVVFFLCLWLAPKFLNTIPTYLEPVTCAKSFGIGLLTFVVSVLVSIVLLFTVVGVPLSFAIIALLILLLSIATAITSICITYKLKEKFAYEKNYLTYLILAGIVIVIWALELIPYVGGLVSFVVKMFGLGTIVYYLFKKNKSEDVKTKE